MSGGKRGWAKSSSLERENLTTKCLPGLFPINRTNYVSIEGGKLSMTCNELSSEKERERKRGEKT